MAHSSAPKHFDFHHKLKDPRLQQRAYMGGTVKIPGAEPSRNQEHLTPKSFNVQSSHENTSYASDSFRHSHKEFCSRSGRTSAIESYPFEQGQYFRKKRKSHDVIRTNEEATEKRRQLYPKRAMTPEISEVGAHPRRTLLFPQSSEEINAEYQNTSINLLNQSTLSCAKIESQCQNLPTLEAGSFQQPGPILMNPAQELQQSRLLNQSFPGCVQRISNNPSPDATVHTIFSQRPSSNTSHHGMAHTGNSSPLCRYPQQHISKNLSRIEREMGEAFYQMKNERNSMPGSSFLRKSMPQRPLSRGANTHSFKINPQLAGLAHQSFSYSSAPRTLPNMQFSNLPQSLPSTSPDGFSAAEYHSFVPSTVQSQIGFPNQHRRMLSSQSTGSEQVSTNMSIRERPIGSQAKLIEEQADVISKLSQRLTSMELKNEEYITLLKELSLRVLGQQKEKQQLEQEGSSSQNDRSGSVLVCQLIEQMNNAEGEREALNHTIVRKDESIAQLSQETQELRKELMAVEHSANARVEEQQITINGQKEELDRKALVIETIQQKACILEDTDQLLSSLLKKVEREFQDTNFKQEVSTVMKVKQLEEFLFNDEASKERRSLGKVKRELAKVKELLTESGAQNEGEIKRLREENKRHKNYIEIIEREVEMQKIMSSTKSLLGKEEDRIRPIGENTQRKLMQRRASQEPTRISKPLFTEEVLESSYDSILSKLGCLQDQISHMKLKEEDVDNYRSERMPLEHSFIKTAEFRSERKNKPAAFSQRPMKFVPEIESSPQHRPRPILREIQNKNGLNRSILIVKPKMSSMRNSKAQLTKTQGVSKVGVPRARSMARRSTVKMTGNKTFCGKENMEEAKRVSKRGESKRKSRSKKL